MEQKQENVPHIRNRYQLLQSDLMDDVGGLMEKADTILSGLHGVSTELKSDIRATAKQEATTALLIALDEVMQPAKAEVALLIADVSKARSQLAKDAAAIRKELLGKDLNAAHAPQPEFSLAPFYWALAALAGGGIFSVWFVYYFIK